MRRLTVALAVIAALALVPAALAAGGLSGKYKTVIKGDTALGGALNGTWTIKFTRGHYAVADNGKVVIHGVNTYTGNTITFTDKSGPDACKGTGKYTFKVTGTKVKFTKVSDTAACAGRQAVLNHTFTKVG